MDEAQTALEVAKDVINHLDALSPGVADKPLLAPVQSRHVAEYILRVNARCILMLKPVQ